MIVVNILSKYHLNLILLIFSLGVRSRFLTSMPIGNIPKLMVVEVDIEAVIDERQIELQCANQHLFNIFATCTGH